MIKVYPNSRGGLPIVVELKPNDLHTFTIAAAEELQVKIALAVQDYKAHAAEVKRLRKESALYKKQHAELYEAMECEDLKFCNLFQLSKRHGEERAALLPPDAQEPTP